VYLKVDWAVYAGGQKFSGSLTPNVTKYSVLVNSSTIVDSDPGSSLVNLFWKSEFNMKSLSQSEINMDPSLLNLHCENEIKQKVKFHLEENSKKESLNLKRQSCSIPMEIPLAKVKILSSSRFRASCYLNTH